MRKDTWSRSPFRPAAVRSPLALSATVAVLMPSIASATDAYIPIVVPVTGFMSVEGGSQRNGALMAIEAAPDGLNIDAQVFDTGTSATGAATALDKALSMKDALAAVTSIFGTEMVAMLPVSLDYEVPLLTISGLARLTESDNPYIFRFLPNDREIKAAHAKFVVDELAVKKPALIGDTTAYGQGGFELLGEYLPKLGVDPVIAETVPPETKDFSTLLAKIEDAGADGILIHSVAAPMALLIKQARSAGIDLPIITSSSLVEPTATALFEPSELADVCAETPSAPESRPTPEISAWADAYHQRFGLEPDGLALGQYDGVMMVLSIFAAGASTPAEVIDALHSTSYEGVAMTYKSDGDGDMAHDADIVCWDGTSRIPEIVKHYSGSDMLIE